MVVHSGNSLAYSKSNNDSCTTLSRSPKLRLMYQGCQAVPKLPRNCSSPAGEIGRRFPEEAAQPPAAFANSAKACCRPLPKRETDMGLSHGPPENGWVPFWLPFKHQPKGVHRFLKHPDHFRQAGALVQAPRLSCECVLQGAGYLGSGY